MDPEARALQLEKDLLNLQQYIEEFTAFVPVGIVLTAHTGSILEVNKAFESLTGKNKFEIIGTHIREVFKDPSVFAHLHQELQAHTSNSALEEAEILTSSGRSVAVTVSVARRGKDINTPGDYFYSFNDIRELKEFQTRLEQLVEERTKSLNERTEELELSQTELKHSLRLVEEEKERTSLIIRNFSDGLILLDEESNVILINPSAKDLLRLRSREIRGTHISELGSEHAGELIAFLEETKSSADQSTRKLALSTEVTVSASIVPITHEENRSRLLVLHDITREAALTELKGEFVSIAAHQMRTPLAAIKWAFEIALAELDPHGEKTAAVRRGYESVDRMLELVNSLLDVDRIESGRFDYHFEKLDLGEFVRLYTQEVAAEKALTHGVRISYQNEANAAVTVNADSEKLRLVLQNLMENSLKYTPAGGEVRLTINADTENAIISVADTGIGIPEEAQKHLFEKFYRADNAKRLVPDGSGLGLYIIKSVTETHGGSVDFKSTPGKGTTFYVRIPLYNQ